MFIAALFTIARTWKQEKAMATHSSTLAWRIPWMEEPGGLQCTESQRVGHDWTTSLSLFTLEKEMATHSSVLAWRIPGTGSLVGCRLWGHTELDTTEWLNWTHDPAIPLLGIHTKETRIERDTCTPMFIAALFTIARTWKQPKCPSADEWIRKVWYIYTMEY